MSKQCRLELEHNARVLGISVASLRRIEKLHRARYWRAVYLWVGWVSVGLVGLCVWIWG